MSVIRWVIKLGYPPGTGTFPIARKGMLLWRWMLVVGMIPTVLLGSVGPAISGGTVATVEVRDSEFDPARVAGDVLPGESVLWEWVDTGEPHNVRQLRGLFRSPISADSGTTFMRTFSAGTFRYECVIHEPFMVGTVKVVIGQDTTPSGLPLIWWADTDTNTGGAFDVQFRIGEDGRWRTWRMDTAKPKGVFGRNDRPVHFNAAKDYWFRARSQKRVDTPTKVSGWAPPRFFD
jgi:plastocyanin